ncbi:hypothetical protein [Georgenia sp. Marseille-Q6866]
MIQHIFRFRIGSQAASAYPAPADQAPDAADTDSWVDYDVTCTRHDSIFKILKAIGEIRDGEAWGPIIAGRGSPAIMLKPVQSETASIILDGNATIEDLRHYFGPWLDDPSVRFELESLDGVGNGAGPSGLWDILASALELARFGLEFYGAVGFVQQVGRHLQRRRVSPARTEAQKWVQFGTLSRRLRRYLHGRDKWDTDHLHRVLGLEPFQLGKLLRQCGFETTPDRPDRWTKTIGS